MFLTIRSNRIRITCRLTGILMLLTLINGPLEARTFKIATLAPAGTTWLKEVELAADRIEERTQSRVKFKFYPGGVMGNDRSVHRKIKFGQLHGGAFDSAGMASFYPDIQLLKLPMLFRSFDEVDYVRTQLDPYLMRNMEKNGFVLLGIAEGGFAKIHSRKPMRDLESIRAGRLWVPEGDLVTEITYQTMDLAPTSLPIADVFTALKTGLI